jgi:DNA-binding response OmpR family regulator
MTSVSDGLAQLSKIFVAQLPRRVADISSQLKILLGDVWDIAHLEHVHRQVHGLTGSAGTFGLPRVSDAARPLELELKHLLGKSAPPDDPSNVQAALQHLVSVVENELAGHPLGAGSHSKKPAQSEMIYVVDDDVDQSEHLRQILLADGYQVRVFNTLPEFESVCERKIWPNAVIMDVIFPDGPHAGALLMNRLRSICPPNMPLVFTSVRDDLEARLLAYRAGASRYLIKPVYPAVLLDLMARLTFRAPSDPYRVLLVDDDLLLAQAMSAILQQAGMKVRTESSPLKAITALRDFDPDVLLLDLYMPNCNGSDLAMVLREQEQHVALPIIFLSTETDVAKQNEALKLGGDDFLVKPVQASSLIQCVTMHARRKREIIIANRHLQQREIDKARQQSRDNAQIEQQVRAEFLANLSETLRTPLNAILGYAQLIQMDAQPVGEDGESMRDSVQEIGKSGQHLLELINDLHDLSKIDAQRMEMHIGPVWLDEMLIATESSCQPMAAARKITLQFADLPRKNMILKADANRLKLVMHHLVAHTIKSSQAESTILLSWQIVNEHDLRITIRSYGKNPGQEQWARLIKRSFDKHLTESHIGLVLSHHLIELMDGQLGVEQGPHAKGDAYELLPGNHASASQHLDYHAFWFELPQLVNADFLQPDTLPELPPGRQSADGEQKSNVLYIEDSVTNLRLMRKILLRRPHLNLDDAPNAELGIPLARKLLPDLILMDLNLPGMNGYDALLELRRIPGLQQTPIIAITANAMKGDAERVLGAGFTAYVIKPIELGRLYTLIDHILPPP